MPSAAPGLQFEGAFYHATTRGNRWERTFSDSADYREFEDTLLDMAVRAQVNLYAQRLMPNHFHRTPSAIGQWRHQLEKNENPQLRVNLRRA